MRRPGIVFELVDAAVMIAVFILMQAAAYQATSLLAGAVGEIYPDLLIGLPSFDVYGEPNSMHDTYRQIALASTVILLVIIISVSAMRFFARYVIEEETPAKWNRVLSGAIISIVLIQGFPYVWDPAAELMEDFTMFILNPEYSFDPDSPCGNMDSLTMRTKYDQSPYTTDLTWFDADKAKLVCQPDLRIIYLLSQVSHETSYMEPEGEGAIEWMTRILANRITEFFTAGFFNIVKALVVFQVLIMAALIGIMADMLTALVITMLPILLVMRLVPVTSRISDRFITALPALYLVPMISAIVLNVGTGFVAGIGANSGIPDVAGMVDVRLVYVWVSSVGVLFFAVTIPVVMVPLVGSVVMRAQDVLSAAVQSGMFAASMAIRGASTGDVRGVAGGHGRIPIHHHS